MRNQARPKRIAVIAGDGIGPEVTAQSVRVLRWLDENTEASFTIDELDYGAERVLRDGVTLPASEIDRIRRDCDAVLFGALGDPRIPDMRHGREILLTLRQELDLYLNVRPAICLDDKLCPLRGREASDVDFVILRENTEGGYGGATRWYSRGESDEVAVHEATHSRTKIERTVRAAFELAASRRCRRLTLADKSNAIDAHRLWRDVFAELNEHWPDVDADTMYADAVAHELVRDPARFEVIVTTNMLGDILSDIGAALQGGLGVAPSANLHPGRVSLFEPVHGSATGLAGKGIGNPVASLLSTAMMLEQLGWPQLGSALRAAIQDTVSAGVMTPDLGGTAGTIEVGTAVIEGLLAAKE